MPATSIDRRRFVALGCMTAAAAALPSRVSAAPVARLGEREVHVFSDGAFPIPSSILSRERPADAVAAAFKTAGMELDLRNVLNVTAVKDGDSWTLFDCGAGDKFLPGSGKLLDALDAAGVDRKKVRRVIFTHGHPDHLWGAVDSFDEIAFPEASFLISEAEAAFWTAPDTAGKLPEDRQMFAAGAARVLKSIEAKIIRFKPGAEVAPGIVALDTAGHSPGHTSFAVSGGGQSLIVVGDAITNAAISFLHPDWRTGGDQDSEKGIATRKRLLDQLATDKLPFIGYHLPEPGIGRAERKDGAYRYVKG